MQKEGYSIQTAMPSCPYLCSFCYHGNMHLNSDPKSHRSIPFAWGVILNPIDIHGWQSVCAANSVEEEYYTLMVECIYQYKYPKTG